MFFSLSSPYAVHEKTAGSHSYSTCSHMKAVMLLTLFLHFCEWLSPHNGRKKRGRGRIALCPTSALSQRLRWIPRVVAVPDRVTPPPPTSLNTGPRALTSVGYTNAHVPPYCAKGCGWNLFFFPPCFLTANTWRFKKIINKQREL